MLRCSDNDALVSFVVEEGTVPLLVCERQGRLCDPLSVDMARLFKLKRRNVLFVG